MNATSPADIRHSNALSCVRVLRGAPGALTITDIAHRTGLSRPTVDAVITGLEARGILSAAPVDASAPGGGRPARRFRFDADSAIVAGVDAGPSNIRVILADLKGVVVARAHRPIDGGVTSRQRVEAVIDTVREALAAAQVAPAKLKAACVGVSGILGADGKIWESFVVPEWNGADVAKQISTAFDAHVFLENDIKLAGFGEHHVGVAQLAENIVYLQLGNRISMSLTLGGRIHQGVHRSAGEIGSQRGMRWTSSSVNGHLTWQSAATAELVFANARGGNPAAIHEIEQFILEIAPHIATVSLVLDPDLIVVGGGLSRAGESFVDLLRTEIHRLIMLEGKPKIVASSLGSDGTLVGALALAFQNSSAELFGISGVPVPDIMHLGRDEVTG